MAHKASIIGPETLIEMVDWKNNMPTVAIIGTRGYPSYYGGFETAVRKLGPYLADRGWDVTVFSRKNATEPNDPKKDPRIKTVETWSIENKTLSTLTHGLSSALTCFRMKPDITLVMNVANGYFLPLLRIRGIPSVVNVDGIEWKRAKWSPLGRSVFRIGAQLCAWIANALIMDSREIQRQWKEVFHVDGTFIPYGAEQIPKQPLEAGLNDGDYVLYVARFVPENSFEEFITAAIKLAETHQIVIVGTGGYGTTSDQRLKELSARYRNIRWLGQIKDDRRLLSLWQHAGVYFHGHSVGGTNPSLVQAMMCGSPIVARDTPYNREVLKDAGVFVDPTPEGIATALDGILADQQQRTNLSECALRRAELVYTWASICEDYERLLSETLLDSER